MNNMTRDEQIRATALNNAVRIVDAGSSMTFFWDVVKMYENYMKLGVTPFDDQERSE